MTPTRKPPAHRFRERVVRSGWVGEQSVAQPAAGDRLRSVVSRDTALSFGHPERIQRIEHSNGATTYYLVNESTIVVPAGARIFWEEA